jgi:hypothetical protein
MVKPRAVSRCCLFGWLICSAAAHAASVELTATLDLGSRFYDYFSDAFAEVVAPWPAASAPQLDCFANGGQACDGFFLISSLPDLVAVGGGDRIFTRGRDLRLGTLQYDGASLTGVGAEIAAVTGFGADADFAPDIAGDDLISEELGPYTTTIAPASVNGTVRFENGVLVGVDVTADVVFDVPIPISPFSLPFSGSISFADHRFTMRVGPESPTIGAVDLVWELAGAVDQVLPGDYDDNGVVEPLDDELWRSAYGRSPTSWTAADGNGDGRIDAADYVVWRDNLGLRSSPPTALGAGATQTPEPSALGIGVGLALLIAAARRPGARRA